jgi:acetolactate synthase-1/2/3 large subunit
MGIVRIWELLFYDKRYVCSTMVCAPDFVKLAEAYGAVGLRATRPDEVESVLAKGLSIQKPVIMDFIVEKEEGVYPMVPAGAAITEMLLV